MIKKSITVILLGSALLLPNHNVEASYSKKEIQREHLEQIKCVERKAIQYDFNKDQKNQIRSFYSTWFANIYKYLNIEESAPIVPEKEYDGKDTPEKEEGPKNEEVPEVEGDTGVEQAPEIEEVPKQEETPEIEEVPEVEETPEIEETPEEEQAPEAPSTPEQTPNPTVPAPSPEEPVEESAPKASVSAIEQEVLNLTNAERQKAGLAPLQFDEKLQESARAKSKDMSVNKYFSHTSPTYGSPFDQMKSFGVTYRSAAENIASGQRTAEEVVRGWMNSPGHRQNILTPNFTHIGIGYDANGNYWTQQFIQK